MRCAGRSCPGSRGGWKYRLARFDPLTGELDLDHMASLIDTRTKLVCCTGASNFLGTRVPLRVVRALADGSGYPQPGGERRSYLLVDGAQLVPGSFVDVQGLDVDYLAFFLSQAAGAVRGECCTPRSTCSIPRCRSCTAVT